MRRLEPEAFAKARLVAVAFVAIKFVAVAPVTIKEVGENDPTDKLPMVALFANSDEPEAVEKPSQEVEVPLANERLEIVPLVIVPFVITPLVANRFVVVAEVPVALRNVTSCKDEEPCTVSEAERDKPPVEVPPPKEIGREVVFPLAVTVWRVAVVVPSVRSRQKLPTAS